MFDFFKRGSKSAQITALQNEISALKNQWDSWGGLSQSQWSEFFTSAASSGVSVTAESAKRVSAVFACVRLIGGSVSLLPCHVYTRDAKGDRARADHPAWWLLNESPYATLTSASFWEFNIANMLLRGGGINQIMRDRNGNPIGFMPIPRECVRIEYKKDLGQLVYFINDGVKTYGLFQDDVLHFPGCNFNGIDGESVIQYAGKQAIGTALAADQFSGEFFANGAVPSTVITYPQGIGPTKEQQDQLREQFAERHVGNGNRHKPLLLVNGGEVKPVTLTAEDAQLLETRKFQVVEIARAFGVPPHMIGETSASTSWGTGIEQMSIGYVRYTLGPHLVRIEQELNRKLWPRSYKYFVEFNRDGLLAGDSKTETEVLSKSLGGPGSQGWMTINEVRKIKNLPPIEGGDKIIFSGSNKGAPSEPNAAATQQ